MATRKPLVIASDGFPEEMPITDDIQVGGVASTGDVALSGGATVTGVPTPTAAGDAAPKSYVDSAVSNLARHQPVRLATAADLAANTPAGSGVGKTLTADANGALTVDGVAAVNGDRVLVKDYGGGASSAHNGIYDVTDAGSGATPWILTRATDADENAEMQDGSCVFVGEGTANADRTYCQITNEPITVDTTALEFALIGTGTVTAGDGLISPSANELAVNPGDGIANVTDRVTVDLETDPGLEFNGATPNGKLRAKVKALGGVIRDADGLSVSVDGVTITLNGSGELVAQGADEAVRLEEDLTAVEAIAAGDPVEWSTTSAQIQKCQAATNAKVDCFGVAPAAISAATSGPVVRRGTVTIAGLGATPGDRYYVDSTGGLTSNLGDIGAGENIVFVGTAKSATELEVHPQYLGRKAA